MNSKIWSFRRWWIFLALSLITHVVSASPEDPPVITSVQLDGTNVVVTARVPAGLKRLTLECRSRLGAGGWAPRAVARLDGSGGDVTFRVPRSAQLEVLRVRADDHEALPAPFYTGTNSFAGQPVNSSSALLGGAMDGRGGAPAGDLNPGGGAPTREVVESDIWQIRGDTLYFFNQYRGLQVIDVSVPDGARVKGTLPLPAAGEQMYLLGDKHVVLLARDGCGWSQDGPVSQALVVNVGESPPRVVATLPVSGYIQESRLVGTALYVASQNYRVVPDTNGSTWEWGTIVSAFDLAEPGSPVARNTLWYAGYGQVATATDRYFFVSTQDATNWRQSVVETIDISDPAGTMRSLNTLRPAGLVKDKFKLDVNGDVFTVISEVGTTTLLTRLETFSFADPALPRKLGELSLGPSERLQATRFDGNRVYIVTFFVQFRMDPLWVVDLSNPAKPAITGQLEIPGWSTYLYPMGNRLVAAGIETNRTTVSLFDVADPAKPALLSRVALGSGWSWSEANMDEKAFNVLPDAGLILVPYQSWTDNESQLRVQLIDLSPDSLVARGAIDHSFAPRRATVHRDRVISVSGTEFLSVDATDRDHPETKGEIQLAWSVDRLFLQGGHIIELSSGPWWWGGSGADRPTLRVAAAADPDHVLNQIDPPNNLPIIGAAVRDGRLYLAQGKRDFYVIINGAGDTNPPPIDVPALYLSIYDVSSLPDLKLLGQTKAAVPQLGWGASLQAVWPRPGFLVLTGGGGYWDPWLEMGARPVSDVPGGFWRPVYWGGNAGRLIAFDVGDATAPKFLSDVNLAENQWWNFSSAYTVDGLVYLSHQAFIKPPPVVTCDDTTGKCLTNDPPEWVWVARSFLDVVDYADPKEPTVRAPANIPGTLKGASHGGELLYTVGPHWKSDTNWWYDGSEFLDASAYDGVEVHLVDSLELSQMWPHPVLVKGDDIFLGRPTETADAKNALEAWTLSSAGKFTQAGKVELPSPAQNLVNFGDLLAVQSDDMTRLFNVTNPSAPAFLSGGGSGGCFWYDLNNTDGAIDRGLWIPLGLYGVSAIPVPTGP